MSQSSFLEDVVGWTPEDCQQRHDEAVPKLVSYFKQAENYHGEIGVLKILCQCFVPCMDWTNLEKRIFRLISQQTCGTFDKILEDVKSEVNSGENSQARENVESLFELLLDILDCVEGSVKYIQGGDNSVELSHIHSLQPLTLHLLKATFSHCKDSGEIYRDLITALSDPLSVLFRKAYSLQMSFLSLLDKINIGFAVTEDDIEDLVAACEGLYGISKLVTTFDIKIAVTLWKAISRYVTQHKVLLRERLDLAGMVIYLCTEIQRGYAYLFTIAPQVDQYGQVSASPGDEKAFMKSLKILGFQMKVLVMLVKEYEGYLADCERPIYILLLHLHRMQPPSLSAPSLRKDHQGEIHRHLLNATEPIVSHLLECSRFITCLTGDETDSAEDTALAHLLLQVVILGLLPTASDDIQEKWLVPTLYAEDEPRQGIIDAVFTAFENCHTEVLVGGSLPGVMCSGKAQRFVSLYEHVCTRLCGYVGSLSADQFPVLESSLLRHVVHADPLCSQLATDVWCFVARYGSAGLCLSHVTLLGELLGAFTPSQAIEYRAVTGLIARLTKFMAPEHQDKLLEIFPPERSLFVWSALPLTDFPVPLQTRILKALLPCCISPLGSWSDGTDRTFSQLKALNSAIEVLCNIFKSSEALEGSIAASHKQSVIQKYCQLWSCLPDLRDPQCGDSPCCHRLLSLTLELGGYLTKYLPTKIFHQAVNMSDKLLQENPSPELKLSMCHFLKHCAKVTLPPTLQQTSILLCISRLFDGLLGDSHCLVQHSACQAFSTFTQESSHELPLPECLQNNVNNLQDKITRHIDKIGVLEMESERTVELLKAQKAKLAKFKQMTPQERIQFTTAAESNEKPGSAPADVVMLDEGNDANNEEPAAKKLKLDLEPDEVEKECGELIGETQRCVQRWLELLHAGQVPHGILEKLRKTSTDLSEAILKQNDHG